MQKDKRSKKIIFVSHCLLNQNAKVQGLANYPGMVTPLVKLLDRYRVGIIQLPCPEVKELGIGRPLGDDTKEMYDTPTYRQTCSQLAEETISLIKDYQNNGYQVACILGVDGSPSCGVNVSPRKGNSGPIPRHEKGIFFEILLEKMGKDKIKVPLIGIAESEEVGSFEESLEKVESLLKS